MRSRQSSNRTIWEISHASCVALQPPLGHGSHLPLLPPTPSLSPLDQHPLLASTSFASYIDNPDEDEDEAPTIIVPESGLEAEHGNPTDGAPGNLPDIDTVLVAQLPGEPWTQSDLSICQQMKAKSRAVLTVLSSLITYVSMNGLARALNPSAFAWSDEDREEKHWLATSNSWWDRKACRWLGLCGVAHYHGVKGRFGHRKFRHDGQIPQVDDDDDSRDWEYAWSSGNKTSPGDWADDERRLRLIPDYVLEYAPLVHLFSGEQFWPTDIAEHLHHVTPQLNYTPIKSQEEHSTLSNLDELNKWQQGRYVFLTSNDNVEGRPPWLEGKANIPKAVVDSGDELEWDGGVHGAPDDLPLDDMEDWYDAGDGSSRCESCDRTDPGSPGQPVTTETSEGEEFVAGRFNERSPREVKNNKSGYSNAPAVLIVVDKGNGVVDAFWFYFYSFNLGNAVLNIRFGNHVGDWEHSLVRFQNGKPKAIFLSEHSFGEAYIYEAVEKVGKRPVIYSATGTHALYATPGTHAYILPWGLLRDVTDRGPLWDPTMNYHGYTYDFTNDILRAANITPHSPTEWFYFAGHWGDKYYPLSDERQYRFAGQYHYVSGPWGPRFKNLGRKTVCQGGPTDSCVIRNWIGDSMRPKRWVNVGEGEMISEEDAHRIFRDEKIMA
ncbi:hypothetical protein PABG_01243 [Paracoccidioides brasiliensis Pb03]|nr:hypothetical protein PABG_01243 [Paracoccidioides brasiliensis Pb03]